MFMCNLFRNSVFSILNATWLQVKLDRAHPFYTLPKVYFINYGSKNVMNYKDNVKAGEYLENSDDNRKLLSY